MSQSAEVATDEEVAQKRSLWHDRNFLTLWSGQALSQFGAQISMLGIPVLAVVLLEATAFQVGVLDAAGLVAFLVIGLPAGAWVDRMRKRHVMIWADGVRALAIASIPILWVTGSLHIWQLYAVAFVIGVATVFFDVSYQSIIPSLVKPDQIAEANGKLESTQQVAHLAGPAFAGGLISLVSAPFAMVVTSFTYVASFVALLFTRDHEVRRPAHEHEPLLREIGEGLRWVFGNRYLRRIVGTTGTSNFFNTVSMTMLPIFLLRELGMTAAAMGLILSLGAVGGVVGAIATPHIVRWVGEGRAIPLSAIAFSVVAVFLPLAAMTPAIAFPLLVVQGFVASFTVLVYNITQVTFRQRITPPRLLGRMNASVRFVVWGVMPIASLLAGLLGTWLGIVPTMWIGAIGQLASALFVVIGPFWLMRTLPGAAEEADAGEVDATA
ncbi:MFS transporter [Microbacterium sp. ASV49]|uniref:MFS transporter n=1 Tax=Microbacterium candidum TaxID=3041922 RepID=A0ABT7MYJ0_9MICO|nr:MFS transporter [Microbacterium sp. ASV49]MDL9979519.1 MFS transporter [Microbacterium sp. ASV49]